MNNLPVEIIYLIFDFFEVLDLRRVSIVCRRFDNIGSDILKRRKNKDIKGLVHSIINQSFKLKELINDYNSNPRNYPTRMHFF